MLSVYYISYIVCIDYSITENSSEPLDMSKRTATKDRGEPPSYFQSILSSNYAHRQSNVPSVYNSNDEASNTSSSSNGT